jgi:hypothetical protein
MTAAIANLADLILDRRRIEKDAARRYRALIFKPSLTKSDAEDLRALIEQLGISADALQADRSAAERYLQNLEIVAKGTGIGKQLKDAQRAIEDHFHKMNEEKQRLQAEHQALNTAQFNLNSRTASAVGAMAESRKLADAHPQLFQDITLPTRDSLNRPAGADSAGGVSDSPRAA